MLRRALQIVVIAWALAAGARADWRQPPDGPIATDRPGNGNAATTVTRGHANIEVGATYANPARRQHTMTFPLLVRLGVLRGFELRAGTGVLGWARQGDETQTQPTDTSLGLKVQALQGEGARPDFAISGDVFMPSGGGPFTADAVLPELRLLVAWALPSGFGLLLNAGMDVPQDASGERYAGALYVVNLNHSAPALDGRLTAFVELFGRQGLEAGSPQIVQVDWGLSGLLSDDLQLDGYLQVGLTDAAPDLQASLGCSLRL